MIFCCCCPPLQELNIEKERGVSSPTFKIARKYLDFFRVKLVSPPLCFPVIETERGILSPVMYWEHTEDRKYYRALIARDLVGHLGVMKENGSLTTARAQRRFKPVATVAEGEKELARLDKLRRRRGYHLASDPLQALMQVDRVTP